METTFSHLPLLSGLGRETRELLALGWHFASPLWLSNHSSGVPSTTLHPITTSILSITMSQDAYALDLKPSLPLHPIGHHHPQ